MSDQHTPRNSNSLAAGDEQLANERYFGVGLIAAMVANVLFGVQRFATAMLGTQETGWWVNLLGAVTLAGLYLYYRISRLAADFVFASIWGSPCARFASQCQCATA